MSDKPKKQEPQFGLDMPFAEAMERFTQTKPKEVEKSIEKSKKKKPPRGASPGRPERDKRRKTPVKKR